MCSKNLAPVRKSRRDGIFRPYGASWEIRGFRATHIMLLRSYNFRVFNEIGELHSQGRGTLLNIYGTMHCHDNHVAREASFVLATIANGCQNR